MKEVMADVREHVAERGDKGLRALEEERKLVGANFGREHLGRSSGL